MKPPVAFDFGSQGCRFEPCRVPITPVETLRTSDYTKKERAQERLLAKVLPLLRRTPFDFASRHPRRQVFRMGSFKTWW
jgi:hypothetical protein